MDRGRGQRTEVKRYVFIIQVYVGGRWRNDKIECAKLYRLAGRNNVKEIWFETE